MPDTSPDISPRWWACEFPERPDDAKCSYHRQCMPCMLALMASVINEGPDICVQVLYEVSEAGEPPRSKRALDVIAEELADLGVTLPRAATFMLDL